MEVQINLLQENQSKAFFRLIDSNRERLEDFFAGTVAKTQSLEDTERYCVEIAQKIIEKSYFPYVLSNEKGDMIGLIDVKNIDWAIPKAELGAFIDRSFEGKGIITQNLPLLIDQIVSEHQFKKLLCRASAINPRSVKVIVEAGFQLEGTIKRDYRTTAGELIDLNYYGKLFN